jgi:hypothetical protein
MAKKKVVETVVKAVKDLPKALEANKAVTAAKEAEKKIDAILAKPNITVSDVKKIETLAKTVEKNLDKAVDLGASTAKNSPVAQVEKAVKTKVTEAKAEAPKPVTTTPKEAPKATTKAAPKAEEAPGPSNLPKSTPTKPTAAPKTPKTPTKTAKAADGDGPKTPSKPVGKIDDLPPNLRPPYGVFPALGGIAAGSGLDKGTPQEIPDDADDPTKNPPKIEIPKIDLPKVDGKDGDGKDGDGKDGDGKDGDGKDGNGKDGDGDGDSDGDGSPEPQPEPQPEPEPEPEPEVDNFATQWLILKAKLLAAGLPESTVDNSVNYFRTILKDGKFAGTPNELENVVDQYLYLPTYQSKAGEVVDSPFYKDFGKFNEKLTTRKKPGELVGLVLGYRRVIDKYVTSDTAKTAFKNDDSITKYMQNDVSVAELDERANAARLRSINADPFYVKALMELKYIDASSDLTAFYLDPNVGTKALEDRRTAGAFATEAVRRASETTGIKLDTEFARQQAARLTQLGYSEAQITQLAGEGYENISEQLRPTEKLSGIYERNLTGGAVDAAKVQQELQSEQFLGTASERRKRLKEQEIQAFRGQSGIGTTALRSTAIGIL